MKILCVAFSIFAVTTLGAQNRNTVISNLAKIKINAASPVKNQEATGTCWSYASTSLIESGCIRKGLLDIDLSEMFTVRNVYIEKAKNYVLRQGNARFDEGALGHDAIQAIADYGIVPEKVYSGRKNPMSMYNHAVMMLTLKKYLDSLIIHIPVPDNWVSQFIAILDDYMGKPPASFRYNNNTYTPQSFAKKVIKFKASDYVFITSFTHHPFYKFFTVEVPDNFSNGAYYNIPLRKLIDITQKAVQRGYTVLWDTDVSNRGIVITNGYALLLLPNTFLNKDSIDPDMHEAPYSQKSRQQLYEKLVTQDDHMMHITGIEKTHKGKIFFLVKNSYGENANRFGGFIHASKAYFAINTITIVVPKSALDKNFIEKYVNCNKQ